MPVGAINQANGADLMALATQSSGQAAPAKASATIDAIKEAVAMAQLRIEEPIGGTSAPSDTGSQLNVFA
jgi:hypothetical protein